MRVKERFNLNTAAGEVGLEVELEGQGFPDNIPMWRVERDGSLRGGGLEFVLATPAGRNMVAPVVHHLYNSFGNFQPRYSKNAGVHVHLNVQDFTHVQLGCLVTLYYALEGALFQMCAPERKGNMFCLRGVDSDISLCQIPQHGIKGGARAGRYGSLNLEAIRKFGSVEFRSLHSPLTPEPIIDWVAVLLKIKDKSLTYNHPRDIMEDMSRQGYVDFCKNVTGIDAAEETLRECVWSVQELAYTTDWDEDL